MSTTEVLTMTKPGTLVIGMAAAHDTVWVSKSHAQTGTTLVDVTGKPADLASLESGVLPGIEMCYLADGTLRFSTNNAMGANHLRTNIERVVHSRELEGVTVDKTVSSASSVQLLDTTRADGIGVVKFGEQKMVGVHIPVDKTANVSVVRDDDGRPLRICIDLV